MKQWDTKKQFKPRYKFVAQLVFTGVWWAIVQPNWRASFGLLLDGLREVGGHLSGVALGLALLLLSPISFPLLCLAEKLGQRRRRLNYIRRNRAADRDI